MSDLNPHPAGRTEADARIEAALKAADKLAEALEEYACAGIDVCPQHRQGVCMADACGISCGNNARKALNAFRAIPTPEKEP